MMSHKHVRAATPRSEALGEIDLADMDKVSGGCQNCTSAAPAQQQKQGGGASQMLQAAAPLLKGLMGGGGAG
jgi:hypothetical protein